jgi:hypothetical protein
MLARASLIVLALASPAWADADGYPAGLFERSPLNDTPAAVSRRNIPAPRKASANGTSFAPSERADGACHHYRVWSYPRPQHCARRARLRPPSKRKTCLMSAQTALVTITASGATRGRNHANPSRLTVRDPDFARVTVPAPAQ